jgi:hypothetical protein
MTFHRHLEMPAGSWKYMSELFVDIFSFVWRVNPTRKTFSRMLDDRVCKFYLLFFSQIFGKDCNSDLGSIYFGWVGRHDLVDGSKIHVSWLNKLAYHGAHLPSCLCYDMFTIMLQDTARYMHKTCMRQRRGLVSRVYDLCSCRRRALPSC